jgi:hypothetical protein
MTGDPENDEAPSLEAPSLEAPSLEASSLEAPSLIDRLSAWLPPGAIARVLLAQDAGALLPAAQAALRHEDTDTAARLARRAALLAPDEIWPYTVLAFHGDGQTAMSRASRALRLDPGNVAILRRIAARPPGGTAGPIMPPERARRRLLVIDPAAAQDLCAVFMEGVESGDPGVAAGLGRLVRLAPELRGGLLELAETLGNAGKLAVTRAIFGALERDGGDLPVARPPAWPLDLVAAVKNGASLASVMVPDPRLPGNAPEYVETYGHDHVILSEKCFWALPPRFGVDYARGDFTAFAYCGDPRLFLRYIAPADAAPGAEARIFYYPGNAYRQFAFVLRHDHVPVYDSARPQDTAALDAAIRAGGPMRVVAEMEAGAMAGEPAGAMAGEAAGAMAGEAAGAMAGEAAGAMAGEADAGLTHVLPVHLCFLYPGTGAVRVMTEYRTIPDLCLHPVEALWPYFAGVMDKLERLNRDEDARQAPAFAAAFAPAAPPASPPGEDERSMTVGSVQARLSVQRLILYSGGACEACGPDGRPQARVCRRFRLFARGV